MRIRLTLPALLLSSLALWPPAPAARAQEGPKILAVSGKAALLSAGRTLGSAQVGQILAPGQAVELAGGGRVRLAAEGGRVEITLTERASLRYDGPAAGAGGSPWAGGGLVQPAGSPVIGGDQPQFSMSVGRAEARVTTGQPLRLVAPLVTAAVRGTAFTMTVAPDGSSEMVTRQGLVEGLTRGGDLRLVSAGDTLSLTASQFAVYLKSQGLNVPGGDWRRVPAAALERVDQKTFSGGGAASGQTQAAAGAAGSSLDALLADPDGSPLAGEEAVTAGPPARRRCPL